MFCSTLDLSLTSTTGQMAGINSQQQKSTTAFEPKQSDEDLSASVLFIICSLYVTELLRFHGHRTIALQEASPLIVLCQGAISAGEVLDPESLVCL